MTDEFIAGGRHGVLEIDRLVDDTYYKFIVGKNPEGQVRQLVTRGPGKEKGATLIPIRVSADLANELQIYARTIDEEVGEGKIISILASYLYTREDDVEREMIFEGLSIPLVMMPREGNLLSGLEWNAPGGTGELGEAGQEIAKREFSEEADMQVVDVHFPFPSAMFASGIYDEVQTIGFALVTGNPQKLVEGARQWVQIPLYDFELWMWDQNQKDVPEDWQTDQFVPVDGKVVMAISWLLATLD